MRAKVGAFRHPRLRWAVLFAVLVAPLAVIRAAPAQAVTLPTGFVDNLITAEPAQPTGLAFTPDGRMMIITKPGLLFVYKDNVLVKALDLQAKTCSNIERGLMGVVADPGFGQGTNRTIYLYYTARRNGACPVHNQPNRPPISEFPRNRVSKFTLKDNNTVDPTSEVVILDNITSLGVHNAGDLHFGPTDGMLYISTGDSGCTLDDLLACQNGNRNATDETILNGKMLRINRDGSVPSGNPFAGEGRRCGRPQGDTGADPARCAEIFATGLRNPFRFAFKPGTSTFHINDVGTGIWEEIDRGIKGADYGFNVREGHCKTNSRTDCGPPPAGLTNPIHDYDHITGCSSIVGGAFVPQGLWSAPYTGSYLFADFVCGKIFRLAPKTGGGFERIVFAEGLGNSSIAHMAFGPFEGTQALYYTTFRNGGEIRRISSGNASQVPPTATFSASPMSASAAPLTVTFDASSSDDPDDDVLSYHWDFGDNATLETAEAVVPHTFTREGAFEVTLRVEDDARMSAPFTKLIEVGRPPTATIDSPSTSARFAVGATVTLSGGGTDPTDGTLAGSDLSWTVIRHHNTHTHPFLGPIAGRTLTFNYPEPEDLEAAPNSSLEAFLTATDPDGISRTVSRLLLPKKVDVTVRDNRASAMRLQANDVTFAGARTFTSWQGYNIRLQAPSPQQFTDRYYVFQSWSDGKPRVHDVITPASATTYTANFKVFDGTAPTSPPPPTAPPGVRSIARTPTGFGYWHVSDTGRVKAFGNAAHFGDASNLPLQKPVVGMAATPTGQGYWLVASDGGIFSYGDARFWGSTGGMRLNRPIVGMASRPTGKGYWLVAADGGIFSFGDAPFKGSTGSLRLNRPIVGMEARPTGQGYWLVAADGGIFSFGDAPFKGSTGGKTLARPIVGMDSTPTGDGYWLTGSDGGVFAFTDARYFGGTASTPSASAVVGMASTPDGRGYWLARADGAVFSFGNAPAF